MWNSVLTPFSLRDLNQRTACTRSVRVNPHVCCQVYNVQVSVSNIVADATRSTVHTTSIHKYSPSVSCHVSRCPIPSQHISPMMRPNELPQNPISIHTTGRVLVDELAESRLCGFSLAFDRLAKSFAFNLNAYSTNCISEVSCSLSFFSLLFKSVTNVFKPWEILTHEWELSLFIDIILISTPYLPCRQQVETSNTGPILVFPLIRHVGSSVSSSLGRVCSRQATASVNCENSAVSFVMKYSPIFNNIQGSCIHTKFAQSVLLC